MCSIQSFFISKADPRQSDLVTLIVGNDVNTATMLDTGNNGLKLDINVKSMIQANSPNTQISVSGKDMSAGNAG